MRDNLRRVSRLCERAQVPLVLCTVVANDAGFAPVGSTEGDEVWQARVEQAAQVLTRGYVAPDDAEDALEQLEQAAALAERTRLVVVFARSRIGAVGAGRRSAAGLSQGSGLGHHAVARSHGAQCGDSRSR